MAASLVAALAQRLVRRICKHCKVEDEMIGAACAPRSLDVMGMQAEDVKAWKGAGCWNATIPATEDASLSMNFSCLTKSCRTWFPPMRDERTAQGRHGARHENAAPGWLGKSQPRPDLH